MSEMSQPDHGYGAESSSSGWSDPLGDRGGDRRGPAVRYPGAGAGTSGTPVSTIVLLVVSGLITLTGIGFLWAAPAVLAVVALVKNSTDPAGARRLSRIGWWVAGGLAVLAVLLAVALVVVLVALRSSSPGGGYGSSTVGLDAVLTAVAGR